MTVCISHSVVSTLRPHGLWPTRILCAWNSAGKTINLSKPIPVYNIKSEFYHRLWTLCNNDVSMWTLSFITNVSLWWGDTDNRGSYARQEVRNLLQILKTFSSNFAVTLKVLQKKKDSKKHTEEDSSCAGLEAGNFQGFETEDIGFLSF